MRDEKCDPLDVAQTAFLQMLSFGDKFDQRILGVIGRPLMYGLVSVDNGCFFQSEGKYRRSLANLEV